MDDAPQHRETPALLSVSLYLLVGLLVLVWGSSLPETGVRYVVGMAVECGLALEALLFMRFERLSIRETLRWRWPGWQSLVLSGGVVFGLWLVSILLNLMTTAVFGYTTPLSPSMFPRNAPEAFLLILSTVVVAPLCEEIMFRGYVQRAYERRHPWIGIAVSGVIFALYHLRFQGAFALMPIAFALGFVAWRSNSLFPGMLLHAAYNSIATAVIIASSFFPMPVVGGLVMALICMGMLLSPVALVALWGFWRVTHPPARAVQPRLTGWRTWAWIAPLIVMFGIYSYAAYMEVLVGRFPEKLAVDALTFETPAAWDMPARWQYVIRGGINQTVGTATCELTPQSDSVELACQVQQDAFEADLPFNLPADFDALTLPSLSLAGEAFESNQRVIWAKADLALRALSGTRETGDSALTLIAGEADKMLRVERANATETAALPPGTLLDGEWPWRLSALPFALTYGSTQPLALVSNEGRIRIVDAFVIVEGGEPAWTPAGNFVTWKVAVSYEIDGEETTLTAWYDVDAPHTLVRYDNGEVNYLLEKVQ